MPERPAPSNLKRRTPITLSSVRDRLLASVLAGLSCSGQQQDRGRQAAPEGVSRWNRSTPEWRWSVGVAQSLDCAAPT